MSATGEQHVPAEVRQSRIRALLATQEFVRVADLAAAFGTSEVTIRNDLVSLEAAGHLRRVHGGAVPRIVHRVEQPFDDTHPDSVGRHTPIGRRAAALVQPGDTLILDVGTTTTAVAKALVARDDLADVVVFTNGLNIALELEAAHPRFTIVVTGGTVRPMQHSLVNPLGDVLLGSIKANLAIIGCNGVDVVGGITNVNLPEAEIKARMLAAVRRRVVVADSSKLGQVELARVCPIADIDVLVTDATADAQQLDALRGAGLEVLVA
jgi:DeoR family transcriptional regulator of aga operon